MVFVHKVLFLVAGTTLGAARVRLETRGKKNNTSFCYETQLSGLQDMCRLEYASLSELQPCPAPGDVTMADWARPLKFETEQHVGPDGRGFCLCKTETIAQVSAALDKQQTVVATYDKSVSDTCEIVHCDRALFTQELAVGAALLQNTPQSNAQDVEDLGKPHKVFFDTRDVVVKIKKEQLKAAFADGFVPIWDKEKRITHDTFAWLAKMTDSPKTDPFLVRAACHMLVHGLTSDELEPTTEAGAVEWCGEETLLEFTKIELYDRKKFEAFEAAAALRLAANVSLKETNEAQDKETAVPTKPHDHKVQEDKEEKPEVQQVEAEKKDEQKEADKKEEAAAGFMATIQGYVSMILKMLGLA